MVRLVFGIVSVFPVCILWGTDALPQEGRGPRMVALEPFFRHPDVKEGDIIEHSFEILNEGDEALEIRAVKPDCGCATADFDRSIPPGGKGAVTLRIDTSGFQGKIKRSAAVFGNEARKEPLALSIETVIRVPIYVSRGYVIFKGWAGERITQAIDVRAELDKPLRLEVSGFDIEQKVDCRIEEVEAGRAYRIVFSNIPGPAERYHGILKLKTNYPEKPEISIRIRAQFMPAKQG